MTNNKFHNLFGQKPRDPEKEKITKFHMDIASSIQKVTEEIMIKLAKSIRQEYNINNLCLAGGVALNCVANGKILEEKIFDKIWIQPAAGDGRKKIEKSEKQNRVIARNSIVANKIIKKNEKFSKTNLSIKRPGNGIPSKFLSKLIGKKSNKNYRVDELIKMKVKY